MSQEQPVSELDEDRTPWIKIRISLSKNRKVLELKNLLKLHSRQEALGVVVDLFTATYIHCWADGNWSKSTPEHLEDLLDWRGEPGELYSALHACEFMENKKVKGWLRHQNRLVSNRLRYYERMGKKPTVQDPNETRLRAKAAVAARRSS